MFRGKKVRRFSLFSDSDISEPESVDHTKAPDSDDEKLNVADEREDDMFEIGGDERRKAATTLKEYAKKEYYEDSESDDTKAIRRMRGMRMKIKRTKTGADRGERMQRHTELQIMKSNQLR